MNLLFKNPTFAVDMTENKITFKDIGLKDEIISAVEALGFEYPTPIQEETIPHLLTSNQDIIGLAQTGTGKTAAFGLPAIHLTDVDEKSPQTLILCPTRELCMQIAKDLKDYAKFTKGINIVAVYGGSSIDTQMKALKKGAHIVVGTPGRTKDLINRRKLRLGNIGRVILDEADEMLTMGFKEDLAAILSETPKEKQTLLFSATMSKDITSVTRKYMTDPLKMSVAAINVGAANVEHLYYMVSARDRYPALRRIADSTPDIYGIVFCRTRRETMEVANKLMQDGYSADAIHGELSQAQRDDVMRKFRKRNLQMLIATDVAARGLDVDDITHVINYNLPDKAEIYTHRSGRTGRAGKSGISVAIIHTRETRRVRDIERVSGVQFSKALVPTGKEICTKQLYSLIDKIVKVEINGKQIEPFLPAIYEKLEGLTREDLIQHFVSAEFNRFLSYYKNARDLNVGGTSRREERERGSGKIDKKSYSERRKTNFARLFINVGNKNGLNPGRLIGVINEALDSGDAMIGEIEILKKFSFFEIEEKSAMPLIKALKGEEFEGVPISLEITANKKPEKKWAYGKKKDFKKQKGGKGRRGESRNRKRW